MKLKNYNNKQRERRVKYDIRYDILRKRLYCRSCRKKVNVHVGFTGKVWCKDNNCLLEDA